MCGWDYKYKRTRSIYFDTEDYVLNTNHISLRHKITADSLWDWYWALALGRGKRHLTLKGESSHDKNNHHASRLEIEPEHKNRLWLKPAQFLEKISAHATKKEMGEEHRALNQTTKNLVGENKLIAHFGVDNNRRLAKLEKAIPLASGEIITATFKVCIDEVVTRRVGKSFQGGKTLTMPLLYLWTFAFGKKIDSYRELEIELDKAKYSSGKKIIDEKILHEISVLGAELIKDEMASKTAEKGLKYKVNKATKAARGYRNLKF